MERGRTSRPGLTVLFVYPWTGRPGLSNPPGWDDIPGAHGSTPEAEGFRDLQGSFAALGVSIFGLSGQDTAHQRELVARLKLPFPILSDAGFAFADALGLPRFKAGDEIYLERLTIFIRDGRIAHVFYPVHPPPSHAAGVLAWLKSSPARL
jgi:peroxiredoxin